IDRAFREWVSELYPITRRATAASGTVGALARAALLVGLPAGVRSMEELRNGYAAILGSRFDPRLRIVAVDRQTVRTGSTCAGRPSSPPSSPEPSPPSSPEPSPERAPARLRHWSPQTRRTAPPAGA